MPRRHIRAAKETVPGRARIVLAIATVARAAWTDGQNPTPINFEGVLWASLRSGLILRHRMPWAMAHSEAGQIVGEGLRKAGGKRPSWAEGQPDHTIHGGAMVERTRCANCGAGLTGEQRKFCSRTCAGAYQQRQAWLVKADQEAVGRRLAMIRL